MECGLAKKSSPSSFVMQSILPNVSVMWGRKAYCMEKEGYTATQGK